MAAPDPLFNINLLFKERKNPVDAFSELGDFFQVLSDYDKWLLSHIDKSFIPLYSIEGIEYASIKTKIAQLIKEIPDEAIKDFDWKKIIGHFLLKAKYWILKKLEEDKTIDSKQQIEAIAENINNELVKTQKNLVVEVHVNNYILINHIEAIVKVVNKLNGDEIEYKSNMGNAKVSSGLFFNKQKIITELGATTVSSETTEILQIKKIDFISDESKWDFKLGKKTISAKVIDKYWLDQFHERKITIQPKDGLKVSLKTSYSYTTNNEQTQTSYEITKVLGVVKPTDNGEMLF